MGTTHNQVREVVHNSTGAEVVEIQPHGVLPEDLEAMPVDGRLHCIRCLTLCFKL